MPPEVTLAALVPPAVTLAAVVPLAMSHRDPLIAGLDLELLFLMPQPGAPPFVKVGDEVSVGTTVCIIAETERQDHAELEALEHDEMVVSNNVQPA